MAAVLEPVSVALKFGFLAVLYLFLLWVARSALRDLRRTAAPERAGMLDQDRTTVHAAAGLGPAVPAQGRPRLVVDRAPGHQSGSAYDLSEGATIGRGAVEIPLEDPFASSRHARIQAAGGVLVLEDLGSTNGTFLNGEPLAGPRPLHPGDRIKIGDSEFTFAIQ